MPINWQDKEVADRLLAAIIASHDSKINCTEVARLYGKDATYNSIENFLRKPKREAALLKQQAEGRKAPAASPLRKTGAAKAKAKVGMGRKAGGGGSDGVMTGRVGKSGGKGKGKGKGKGDTERIGGAVENIVNQLVGEMGTEEMDGGEDEKEEEEEEEEFV